MTSPCDVLGAAKIDIDSITVGLQEFSGREQLVRVICAKLNYEWPVSRSAFLAEECVEKFLPLLFMP